jgi:hypothetical protein
MARVLEGDGYTEQAIEALRCGSFIDIQTVKLLSLRYDWSATDETVPLGRESRLGGRTHWFLSPDSQQFHNRRAGLAYMVKEEFEQEEVEEMRQMLRHEG